MRLYLANGARLAVLVDPIQRTVECHRPGQEPEQRHTEVSRVSLDPELAGFTLDLEPVWG